MATKQIVHTATPECERVRSQMRRAAIKIRRAHDATTGDLTPSRVAFLADCADGALFAACDALRSLGIDPKGPEDES